MVTTLLQYNAEVMNSNMLKITVNRYQFTLICSCVDISINNFSNRNNVNENIKCLMLEEFIQEQKDKLTLKKLLEDKIRLSIKPSLQYALLWALTNVRGTLKEDPQDNITIIKFIEVFSNYK